MKISIITVCYNSEKHIHTAIESILSQTYENVEYILVDGGSKDNTISIIKQFEPKFKGRMKWISEEDNGLYHAMNKGILMASGDVIGILNSDDIYEDCNVLNDVMNSFKEDQSLSVLFGDLFYVKENDTSVIVRKWKSKSYSSTFFKNGDVPPHPSLFVTKQVYKDAGLFDLDYTLAADYEFMFRILKKYNFNSKYLSRLMVRMRLGGASNKSLSSVLLQNKEVLNAWKKNGVRIPLRLMPLRIIKRFVQFI